MEHTSQSQEARTTLWQQFSQTTRPVLQVVSNFQRSINTNPFLAAIKNIALFQFLHTTQGSAASSFILAAELPSMLSNLPELTRNTAPICVFTKNMALKLLVKAAVYFFPSKLPQHTSQLYALINENPSRKKC